LDKSLISLLLLSLVLALGCAKVEEESNGEANLSCNQFGIRNGDEIGTAERPLVGYLLTAQGSLCTGTLITSGTVMTAAHCVSDDADNVLSPNQVVFSFGANTLEGEKLEVAKVEVHPDYTGQVGSEGDIALLILKDKILVDTFYRVYQGEFALDQGESVEVVGYGQNEVGTAGIKRLGTVDFRRFTSAVSAAPNVFLEFNASQSEDQNVCPGDSGGPAIVERGGVKYIIGVASAINGTCNSATKSFHTSVDLYGDFIETTLSAANDELPQSGTTKSLPEVGACHL